MASCIIWTYLSEAQKHFMRFLYSLLIIIGTPFVLLYFAIRGLRDRAYLTAWDQRFGYIQPGKQGGILLHAASVGECAAAKPLIKALLGTYPDLPFTVTTITPTGADRVRSDFGGEVDHYYLPLDLSSAVTRFLHRLRPKLIIVMETEIWPNLFQAAQLQNIPLIIANARLSSRSVARYQHVSGFVRSILQPLTWIGAQSTLDAEHLTRCGADPQNVELTGNIKFEPGIPDGLIEQSRALSSLWNTHRLVLVAGSTHEADERVVIPAFCKLLENLPEALLILVPRYPERFNRAAQLAKSFGLLVELHSADNGCSDQVQCLVVDTMGELMACYAAADTVFVGGSFGAEGGHNPLEPAVLGKPILVGPKVENSKELVALLVACNAALLVTNQQDFYKNLQTLMHDHELRNRMGQSGQNLVKKNKGALGLTMAAIARQLGSSE